MTAIPSIPKVTASSEFDSRRAAAMRKKALELEARTFSGYPGLSHLTPEEPRTRAWFSVDAANYVAQKYPWDCGPSTMMLAFRLLGGPMLTHQQAIGLMGANAALGTGDFHFRDAAEQFADLYEYQMGEHGSFDLLHELLATRFIIIVNFREPEDREGHFALVKSLGAATIEFSDPWFGPCALLPLSQFEWRSGFEEPAKERWYFAIKAHEDS